MLFFRFKYWFRFNGHWVVLAIILGGLVVGGVVWAKQNPTPSPSVHNVIQPIPQAPAQVVQRDEPNPAGTWTEPHLLTMPVELALTPEEIAQFELVNWLPATSTLTIRHDAEQAQTLLGAFNRLRVEAGMSPLTLAPDLAQRADIMARSGLAFRLYGEDSSLFSSLRTKWLAYFGITQGGISFDMHVLPATMIASGTDEDQLTALFRDGPYGVLVDGRYTQIGIGIGRVDGWDTGGMFILLFR